MNKSITPKTINANPTSQRRWDLLGVAGFSLLFSLITTTPSSYFVHADAASQDFMALSWINGCWEFLSEKMTSLFVLGPLFRLFGSSPFWDTVSLAVVAAITLVLTYELARDLTGSRFGGILAALFLSALPTYQFFSRVHISYALMFFTGAWLAVRRNHWGWAGFCFAMAPMSHFGATVPVGISLGVLALLYLRPAAWKPWFSLIISGLAPILVVEALFFFYTGQPFLWIRSTLVVGLRWSGVNGQPATSLATPTYDLGWLPHMLLGSNGLVLTLLLVLAIPAFFLLVRKDKVGSAMIASVLLAVAAFTFVAALHPGFVSRSLAFLYPVWSVGVAVMVCWLIERVVLLWLKEITIAAWLGVLILFLLQTGFYIRNFTQTPYPVLEQWFQRAIAEKRPMRYEGLTWIPLYYFGFQGDEILVDDPRWLETGQTGQDVLVFEGHAPANINPEGYTVTVISMDDSSDVIHPVLTGELIIPRRYEIWWPDGPSQPIGPQTIPAGGAVSYYYSGVGCATPPPYGGGTQFFYQLVWSKLTKLFGG